jgi:hypothetical protein
MAFTDAKAKGDARLNSLGENGGDGWTLSDAIIPTAQSADAMILAELMQS